MEADSHSHSHSHSYRDPGKFSRIVKDLSIRLSRRSEKDDLVSKNILKDEDSVSPTILQKKLELEKERTQDQLNRRISNRPSAVDLKLRNILRVDSDDSIERGAHGLQKNMNFNQRAEGLHSILKRRSSKVELEDKNILIATDVDPRLVSAKERLKRAQLRDSLDDKLRSRPNPEEISHLIHFDETVEVHPTFRKSEYNRKPDGNSTYRKLTPQMKVVIRQELNSFKKEEMKVHHDSENNTCFH